MCSCWFIWVFLTQETAWPDVGAVWLVPQVAEAPGRNRALAGEVVLLPQPWPPVQVRTAQGHLTDLLGAPGNVQLLLLGLISCALPSLRNCNVPEEPEDDDLIHPTYEKTYKKKWVLEIFTKLSALKTTRESCAAAGVKVQLPEGWCSIGFGRVGIVWDVPEASLEGC